jgi:hypothetical protein
MNDDAKIGHILVRDICRNGGLFRCRIVKVTAKTLILENDVKVRRSDGYELGSRSNRGSWEGARYWRVP